MFPDAGGDPDPATTAAFASSAAGPAEPETGPDGNLYYVDFNSGTIRKIGYGLQAVATALPTIGGTPLSRPFERPWSTPPDAVDPRPPA